MTPPSVPAGSNRSTGRDGDDFLLSGFAVVVPDRRRFSMAGATRATTVRELVQASGIGLPADASHVEIDGAPVALDHKLAASGVRHGSVVRASPGDARVPNVGSPRAQGPVVEVVWTAGFDAGGVIGLAAGQHFVGRARSAAVRCDDRSLESHHAVVEVLPDGSVSITQLAGRQPIAVDGAPVAGRTPIVVGQHVDIGLSTFVLRAAREHPPTRVRHGCAPTDPWRLPLVRAPRAAVRVTADVIAAPRRASQHAPLGSGLLPTLLGVGGAAVLALVFHQVMFLLFGLMGALVAIGTWAAQRFGLLRSRRSASRSYASALTSFERALALQQSRACDSYAAATPTLASAIETMTMGSVALWNRRAADADSFDVSIGVGDVPWRPGVAGIDGDTPHEVLNMIDSVSRLERVPVTASLGPQHVLAIAGERAKTVAVARALVLQLAAVSGPADWRLALVTESPDEWLGFAWLGHLDDTATGPRIVAPAEVADFVNNDDSSDARHLVVVVDNCELLASRTAPLRRLLASGRSLAAIVMCADEAHVPAIATSSLVIGRIGAGRWLADTRSDVLAEPVRVAGISSERAHDACAAIARFVDPECSSASTTIPRDVELLDLLHRDVGRDENTLADRILRVWTAAGNDATPVAPIGVAADGVVEIDLVNDGPHALIAGTTGAGKSELLRSLVLALAVKLSPDQISFVLVDYKGGSTFDGFLGLPHVVGLVTDLDGHLASRALRSLEAELRRRERLLREVGAADLTAYRSIVGIAPLPRLVVVIDEFATLAVQQPDFLGALLGVAQRGRSLGVHLLLATQRPGGVVNDDIRANTNLRIALRVQDASESVDVIGNATAAGLPRSVPGRAVMRLGAEERIVFQTATCAAAMEMFVNAIRHAAEIGEIAPPHRPWLPPLESSMAQTSLPVDERDEAIGVIDDPDHQRVVPLRWTPAAGHLLIVGAPGMGSTTTLVGIAANLDHGNHGAELYVVDATGDTRLSLIASLPTCAGVVRLHEQELLWRLLAHVHGHIAVRKATTANAAARPIVVIVDGLIALRNELDSSELHDQLDQLDEIIAEGPSVGVCVIATTTHAGNVPSRTLSQIGRRWVLHLSDPQDGAALGLPSAFVPPPIPGRMIDVHTRLEGHVFADGEQRLLDHACSLTTNLGSELSKCAAPLRTLPEQVEHSSLPASVTSGADLLLPLGLAFTSLQPVALPIATGEHVLVIGPSRSGRTTALRTIAATWQQSHPSGRVVSIAARRTGAREGTVVCDASELHDVLDVLGHRDELLIVVDDAEMVDDPAGNLARLVASRREGVTVVAAGRPDALRSAYGHWTTAVRRSRLGLVMAACTDLDGDLLNVVLPRRLPIPARPGLAWLIADGDKQLIQVAVAPVRVAEPERAVARLPRHPHHIAT